MSEMMKAWEHSCKKPKESWTDKSRFYDTRKRPTGRPRDTTWSMTPEGEALHCEKMGLGDKIAEPMERELKEDI